MGLLSKKTIKHDAGISTPGTWGRTRWVFSAGFAPSQSTGQEPEFSSRNTLCLLNTGERPACVALTFYFEDQDPAGPFEVLVEPQRVKHQRVNSLIDPQAIPLDTAYGVLLESDEPIVAQLYYLDSRNGQLTVSHLNPAPLDHDM